MKHLTISLALHILFLTSAIAAEMPVQPSIKVSPELERMKTLAGHWVGTSKDSKYGTQNAEIDYRVTSGGSAVVETEFPGTPHEMVSVYHDKNGKLSMTHYCMLGNQPEMDLKSVEAGKMIFDTSAESHAALQGQQHMHGLTLEQPSADELVQTWLCEATDGKTGEPTVISLKKVAQK